MSKTLIAEVNRSAILVTPKQSFLDWLHSVDPTSAELTLDDVAKDPAVYLVAECPSPQAFMHRLRALCPVIFEEQVDGWWTDRSVWPANRTSRTFRDWFDFRLHSWSSISATNPYGYTREVSR